MKPYKYLLFDLDGTLTDSEEGILNCVRYGLESCGFPVPEYEVLRAFIGPPLMYSCTHFCGLGKADSERVILKYRERYSEKGIFENKDGVVVSKISKDDFFASKSEQFIEDTFNGSLPAFLAFNTRSILHFATLPNA